MEREHFGAFVAAVFGFVLRARCRTIEYFLPSALLSLSDTLDNLSASLSLSLSRLVL